MTLRNTGVRQLHGKKATSREMGKHFPRKCHFIGNDMVILVMVILYNFTLLL